MIDSMRLRDFRFWCQKVLPLVYDNSLSYYEVLCKVTDYLNKIIEGFDIQQSEIDQMLGDIEAIKIELSKIVNGDYEFIEQIISKAIKTVFFGLTNSGYFVAYIPESWDDITFLTTGYDTVVESMPEYGHLVLAY